MDSSDETPPLGEAWYGWNDYLDFAQSVKEGLRYVRYEAVDRFLGDVVGATCQSREVQVPQGTLYWRARLGCNLKLVSHEADDDTVVTWHQEEPYTQDEMKPISNWRAEGRANPRGIPHLYMATTRDTALSEVRPWVGSLISVAEMQTTRPLRIIDCSKYHDGRHLAEIIRDQTLTRQNGIWAAIDHAFARPVTREDEGPDYIPTQILSELFKKNGFDGVMYKSLLTEDGLNIVLFNMADAEVLHSALYKPNAIRFDFVPAVSVQ